MVHDDVWAQAGMTYQPVVSEGGDGIYLCIGCLERRLGRELVPADFKAVPVNLPHPWNTPRLAARLGGEA